MERASEGAGKEDPIESPQDGEVTANIRSLLNVVRLGVEGTATLHGKPVVHMLEKFESLYREEVADMKRDPIVVRWSIDGKTFDPGQVFTDDRRFVTDAETNPSPVYLLENIIHRVLSPDITEVIVNDKVGDVVDSDEGEDSAIIEAVAEEMIGDDECLFHGDIIDEQDPRILPPVVPDETVVAIDLVSTPSPSPVMYDSRIVVDSPQPPGFWTMPVPSVLGPAVVVSSVPSLDGDVTPTEEVDPLLLEQSQRPPGVDTPVKDIGDVVLEELFRDDEPDVDEGKDKFAPIAPTSPLHIAISERVDRMNEDMQRAAIDAALDEAGIDKIFGPVDVDSSVTVDESREMRERASDQSSSDSKGDNVEDKDRRGSKHCVELDIDIDDL